MNVFCETIQDQVCSCRRGSTEERKCLVAWHLLVLLPLAVLKLSRHLIVWSLLLATIVLAKSGAWLYNRHTSLFKMAAHGEFKLK